MKGYTEIPLAELSQYAPNFRQALEVVCESPAFRTSPKSCEFLRHIVHRALSGDTDELKERLIGMSLLAVKQPTIQVRMRVFAYARMMSGSGLLLITRRKFELAALPLTYLLARMHRGSTDWLLYLSRQKLANTLNGTKRKCR
jgi:hypothetical protein